MGTTYSVKSCTDLSHSSSLASLYSTACYSRDLVSSLFLQFPLLQLLASLLLHQLFCDLLWRSFQVRTGLTNLNQNKGLMATDYHLAAAFSYVF